jgi:hypothetical protein
LVLRSESGRRRKSSPSIASTSNAISSTSSLCLPECSAFKSEYDAADKQLAKHGATTRQLMDMLGHDNIQHAELYSREAEQEFMAAAAMQKLMNWRRKPVG